MRLAFEDGFSPKWIRNRAPMPLLGSHNALLRTFSVGNRHPGAFVGHERADDGDRRVDGTRLNRTGDSAAQTEVGETDTINHGG